MKINDFIEGKKIILPLLVSNVSSGITNAGNIYFNITLQDRTGTIEGKKWEIIKGDEEIFKNGKVVLITGDVIKHRDKLQVKILSGAAVASEDINHEDFIAPSPISKEELLVSFKKYCDNIKDPNIKAIIDKALERHWLTFSTHPAAKSNHHNHLSGLLYHVTSMLQLAEGICNFYKNLNRDLLYAGIILHDLGKTVELTGAIATDYTTEGKLVGHISIMSATIKMIADELKIDNEIPILLQHMVLAHHGKLEFGSPVLPLLIEAEVLCLIDNLDSKVNMITKALDLIESGKFTNKLFALDNRSFYKPKLN